MKDKVPNICVGVPSGPRAVAVWEALSSSTDMWPSGGNGLLYRWHSEGLRLWGMEEEWLQCTCGEAEVFLAEGKVASVAGCQAWHGSTKCGWCPTSQTTVPSWMPLCPKVLALRLQHWLWTKVSDPALGLTLKKSSVWWSRSYNRLVAKTMNLESDMFKFKNNCYGDSAAIRKCRPLWALDYSC